MKMYAIYPRSACGLALAACVLMAGCSNNGGDQQTSQPSQAVSTKTPDTKTEPEDASFQLVADESDEEGPEGDWGTLRGRFVYGGDAPEPDEIVPTKDVEYCGQHNLVDQSLVVNEEGQLANVFVFIYVPRGQTLEVHESYAETANDKVVLDNNQCAFEPHCLAMRLSQPLSVKNSDPVGHNTNVPNQFNLLVPSGNAIEHKFARAITYPLPVACNIHPWMKAHLLIREDPYAVISAGDGSFEMKNIPAGEHEFVFWHERPGNLGNLEAGNLKTDRRGRMKIDIPAGKIIDLGEIEIPADALQERY